MNIKIYYVMKKTIRNRFIIFGTVSDLNESLISNKSSRSRPWLYKRRARRVNSKIL